MSDPTTQPIATGEDPTPATPPPGTAPVDVDVNVDAPDAPTIAPPKDGESNGDQDT